jgi:two-component system phosphate regulon sensor histidine kinase PhoR
LLDLILLKHFDGLRALITFILVLLAGYLIVRFVINRFIYEKIKLIYKTIYDLNKPKSTLKSFLASDSNALEKVNREVIDWAETQKSEIELLKEQELYRRDFLGNVSHELKTPIFNIQGYVHTLLDGGLEDEEINRKFLKRAEKSIERLISVVEDLDSISNLESGRLEMNLERINIVELAKEVMEMEEMKADQRNMTIKFSERYDKPVHVMADGHQIRQVYINLMDNSIKYGNKKGTVKLGFHDMDEHILCEVTDDGPGIEAKHLPRIFERFYRIDKARDRNAGGSGLGLAIVKHIIEAHDQILKVHSQTGENHGTKITFTLRKAN